MQPSVGDLFLDPFVPTLVFVREMGDFHTRLSAYNYYSELFPQTRTGAKVHMWFFRNDGQFISKKVVPLAFKGQMQFDVQSLGVELEGTAGLSLIPDTMPEKAPKTVGSGYYVEYSDDRGHRDYSHEWEAMKFRPFKAHPWLCVVRPRLFPETKIIVMNSYYGELPEGTARLTMRLRNQQGRVLREKEMPPLPGRSSRIIALEEIAADYRDLAAQHEVLAVEADGTNIQGPFTWVRHPGGDFNIHHFC